MPDTYSWEKKYPMSSQEDPDAQTIAHRLAANQCFPAELRDTEVGPAELTASHISELPGQAILSSTSSSSILSEQQRQAEDEIDFRAYGSKIDPAIRDADDKGKHPLIKRIRHMRHCSV